MRISTDFAESSSPCSEDEIYVYHKPDQPALSPDNTSCIEWYRRTYGEGKPSSWQCPLCGHAVDSDDIVGAHVEDKDGKVYITPMCRKHNSEGQGENIKYPFKVKKYLLLPTK